MTLLPAPPPKVEERAPQHELTPTNEPVQAQAAAPGISTNPVAKSPSQSSPSATQGDPPTTDELARTALSFAGMDPEAEEYWISAINDPNLSHEERKNLIEDLNEDGLSDPQHPTSADLPMIRSRLELIEELAPSAMDQTNADAFQEAYKDLLNLSELAQGRGHPVQ